MINRKKKVAIKQSVANAIGKKEILCIYQSLICYQAGLSAAHSVDDPDVDKKIQSDLETVNSCIAFFETYIPEKVRESIKSSLASESESESEV